MDMSSPEMRRTTGSLAGRKTQWRVPVAFAAAAGVGALWLAVGTAREPAPVDVTPAPAAAPAATSVPPVAPPPTAQLALPTAVAVAMVPAPANQLAAPAAPVLAPAPDLLTPARLAAAQALQAPLRADLAAGWARAATPTALRGGPSTQSAVFSELPKGSALKLTESRGDFSLVFYDGDGASRVAGPGWVRTADLQRLDAPSVWLQSQAPTSLWAAADSTAKLVSSVPAGTGMEVVAARPMEGSRIQVRLPGDGRQVQPSLGWVEAQDVVRMRTPLPQQIPWSFPSVLDASTRIKVPYRTQLDGTPAAGANCGPATLGMVAESFGINATVADIRTRIMLAQGSSMYDVDNGSYVWALADVATQMGLKVFGLREADGTTLRRWTVEEARAEVQRGNPVVLQVRYRSLPRREEALYYGDHYIVLTGILGDSFIYNDSIWGPGENEGPGYDRVITAANLRVAMNAADREYAYTGFALNR
ncbi:MAG: C39 family peptidase [Chloroflexi bacterium]|nr:C39 family peptidase [Chloroflexota bacterium]